MKCNIINPISYFQIFCNIYFVLQKIIKNVWYYQSALLILQFNYKTMELVKELVKGYRQVPYDELQQSLFETFKESKKSYVELAYELEARSVSTAQNAIVSDKQMVSDEILTKVFNFIGLNAFVVWMNGERKYYIKN